MPQKRGEAVEKLDLNQIIPDTYERWLSKQVEARSGKFPDLAAEADKVEGKVDKVEDLHEKAHRRKRGKTR